MPPGKLVERARMDAGLSQRDLARRAGTTQAVIARIEAGLVSPRWDTVESLLAAAGFELRPHVDPAPVQGSHMLSDVRRILRLSPEDRIREVASLNRFVAAARRVR